MTALDPAYADQVRGEVCNGHVDVTCGRAYPPNRHLTCVRVSGHPGQHVWVSDDSARSTSSSTVTWRDHPDGCGCCYCAPVDAPVAAAAP